MQELGPRRYAKPVQPVTPSPKLEPKCIPIARAERMSVSVPLGNSDGEGAGRVDGFSDDIINVFLDTPDNRRRQPHIVTLAMHPTSRPHAGNDREPIIRRELLSLPKLEAEGAPAEVQTVQGWKTNS